MAVFPNPLLRGTELFLILHY